jgi:hypothetical protein
MLGMLWPLEVYKLHERKDPPTQLVKNYSYKGRSVRGILREPSYGRPIGTIEMTEDVMDTVHKVTEAANSETAPRGAEQADEVFNAVVARAGIAVAVTGKSDGDDPEALGISFKSTDKGSQQQDDFGNFLNDLWSGEAVGGLAATPTKRKSAGGRGGYGKKPRGDNVSAAQRSHQLGLSESVALKAKLALIDLESNSTVLQQSVKKLDNILTSITARTSDKVMEHYAADYNAGALWKSVCFLWLHLGSKASTLQRCLVFYS